MFQLHTLSNSSPVYLKWLYALADDNICFDRLWRKQRSTKSTHAWERSGRSNWWAPQYKPEIEEQT